MNDPISVLGDWMHILAVDSVLAGIVFAVVAIMTKLAPQRGPAVHAALWSLVLIRLVLPPGLGHPFGAGTLVNRVVHRDIVPQSLLRVGGNEGTPMAADQRDPTPYESRDVVEPLLPALGALWFVGFLAVAALQLRRLRRVRTVLECATPAVDPAVLAACESWRRRLCVRRKVRVVTSTSGLTPFTVGVVRPVIFLPRAVLRKSRCMEAAIAHEMAHVARFDALWLRLQQLVQTVYFFNPIVWIVGVRFNDAREQLCDATVVAADRLAARDYVGGLLDLLQLELRGVGAPTMTARKRRIGMRIRNIFRREGGSRPKVGAAVFSTAVVGVFLLPMGSSEADSPASPVSIAAEQTVSDPASGEREGIANPLPEGRVTWSWGPGHLDPFTHKEVSHRGIDLAAPTGTPVVSPADGVVRVATENYGESAAAGTVILIDHDNGLSTFFAHLNSLGVVEGQRVEKGAEIATVGSTGKSTGPHLHFEVRRDGESADPAEFVEEWRK